MHLLDTFIQSDLHCFQAYVLSVYGNETRLCVDKVADDSLSQAALERPNHFSECCFLLISSLYFNIYFTVSIQGFILLLFL